MRFAKAEALGNDFVIVDAGQLAGKDVSRVALQVCRRSLDLGADGLILFRETEVSGQPRFSMQVFNADGSEAEISGNGLRCLAALLIRQGQAPGGTLVIQTGAGAKRLRLTDSKTPGYCFNLLMGEPILEPAAIDFRPDPPGASLVRYPLMVEDRIHPVTVTSMGNPHCSLLVADLEKTDWEGLGRLIEVHPCFPRRTNVEFVQILDRCNLAVRFWERGTGKTLASGTGGCAAVVAACLNGVSDRDVQVHTPGGILQVHWQEDNQVSLTGPARIVCQGQYYPLED
ncbi:MAG: diaminopimelate epimerase [Acidobacteriota bacterium]|nr:diaminopimelate epimerase [Acidobacteriota bacterium]